LGGYPRLGEAEAGYTTNMGESYYAGGRKVELNRDEEYVAVVQEAAHRAGLDAQVETASKANPRQGSSWVVRERLLLTFG
jgi:hypothetical protein